MNKEKIISDFLEMKKLHAIELQKTRQLISGSEIKHPCSLDKTNCNFGKFFYSQQDILKEILGTQFFKEIEDIHDCWHEKYSDIFNIFYNKSKGFFSKEKISLKKVDSLNIDKAKFYFTELSSISHELTKVFEKCEQRMNAVNKDNYDAIFLKINKKT